MDIKINDGRKSVRKQKDEGQSQADAPVKPFSITTRKSISDGESPQPAPAASETPAEPAKEHELTTSPARRVIIKPLSEQTAKPEPAPTEDKKPTAPDVPEETHDPSEGPDPASSHPATTPVADEEGTLTKKDSDKIKQDVKDAEEAASKRDLELKQYIEERRFFVPINAVGHRRSVITSAWLTLLMFLLSLFLVNLMLDAGLILLLEKVPHTNFFGNG